MCPAVQLEHRTMFWKLLLGLESENYFATDLQYVKPFPNNLSCRRDLLWFPESPVIIKHVLLQQQNITPKCCNLCTTCEFVAGFLFTHFHVWSFFRRTAHLIKLGNKIVSSRLCVAVWLMWEQVHREMALHNPVFSYGHHFGSFALFFVYCFYNCIYI